MVRIGLIGAGGMLTRLYAPVLPRLKGAQVVALADPSEEARQSARQAIGASAAYAAPEAMIEAGGLDAVLIASPPALHVAHVAAAAAAGLHVFCEKPMARSVAEADAIIDACAQAGVVLQVGFNRRYLPALWTAGQMVRAGELGEVFSAECIWTSWTCDIDCGWRDRAECLGGNFQDHGAHSFDTIAQWLGPIEGTFARANCVGPIIGRDREVEDHVLATATHPDGRTSLHLHSRSSHRPVSEFYRIYGTAGTLELESTGEWSMFTDDPWTLRLYSRGKAAEILSARRPAGDGQDLSEAKYCYFYELSAFVRAAEAGIAEGPTGEDGKAAVAAVAASLVSAAEDRFVPIEQADRFDREIYRSLMTRLRR